MGWATVKNWRASPWQNTFILAAGNAELTDLNPLGFLWRLARGGQHHFLLQSLSCFYYIWEFSLVQLKENLKSVRVCGNKDIFENFSFLSYRNPDIFDGSDHCVHLL